MSKDLVNKILITLGFILLFTGYWHMCQVPGVNINVVKEFLIQMQTMH